MEETRRIGIVGRWVTHWSFWPTYAVGIMALLAVTRPWQYWFAPTALTAETTTEEELVLARPEDATPITTAAAHSHWIRVHGGQDAPRSDGSVSDVGVMAITTSEARPDAEWIACDGRAVPRADYPELAAWIGNRFGSDAENVVLPDFSKLYPMGRMTRGSWDWLWLGRETEILQTQHALTPLRFWIKAR